MNISRKTIHVCCAVIINTEELILAVQRSESMSMPLKWEFPGGKIEEHETAAEALQREIREELRIEIAIVNSLSLVTHAYENFDIVLYPFVSRIIAGSLTLVEHQQFAWIKREDLLTLDWAEADIPIITGIFS